MAGWRRGDAGDHRRPVGEPTTTVAACALVAVVALAAAGCRSSRTQLLAAEESQVKLRSIQTRAFDSTDKNATLRAAMATLQDLGFVLDDADDVLGTVTATKLDRSMVRMTVSVRPRGTTQLLVRASAQYNLRAIEDPEPYQQFFEALGKAMFLAAQDVE